MEVTLGCGEVGRVGEKKGAGLGVREQVGELGWGGGGRVEMTVEEIGAEGAPVGGGWGVGRGGRAAAGELARWGAVQATGCGGGG